MVLPERHISVCRRLVALRVPPSTWSPANEKIVYLKLNLFKDCILMLCTNTLQKVTNLATLIPRYLKSNYLEIIFISVWNLKTGTCAGWSFPFVINMLLSNGILVQHKGQVCHYFRQCLFMSRATLSCDPISTDCISFQWMYRIKHLHQHHYATDFYFEGRWRRFDPPSNDMQLGLG